MHRDTSLLEWKGDPARSDAELKGGTVSGKIGQKVHGGVNEGRVEYVWSQVVVLSNEAIEVVRFRHRYILSLPPVCRRARFRRT